MSLKDKLQNQGSNLTPWNGSTPSTNRGATKQSTLHGNGEEYGYSTSGATYVTTNLASELYDNGGSWPLRQPSNLDMAGGAKISEPTYGHNQKHSWVEGQNYDDLGPVDGRY